MLVSLRLIGGVFELLPLLLSSSLCYRNVLSLTLPMLSMSDDDSLTLLISTLTLFAEINIISSNYFYYHLLSVISLVCHCVVCVL